MYKIVRLVPNIGFNNTNVMKIDEKAGLPLYKQIENYIREEINSGKFNDGSFLPREENLANKFGVSRNTVRQGISNLVHEGVLKRTPGKGTVLAERTITTKLSEWHSFRNEMQKKGVEVKDYFVKSGYEYAPEEAYKKLKVDGGRKIFKLERLKGDSKEPFVYFISWFHPRVEMDENDDYSGSLYTILEEKYSVIPAYSEEELDAIEADEEISELLQIDLGKPVLFRKRVVLDSRERTIEFNLGFYRSDKFKYSIRFEKK